MWKVHLHSVVSSPCSMSSFFHVHLKITFQSLHRESGCIHISAAAFSFTESQKSKFDSFESGICFSSILLLLATDVLPGPVSAPLNKQMSPALVLLATRAGVFGLEEQKKASCGGMWKSVHWKWERVIGCGLKFCLSPHGPKCHVATTLWLFHHPLWIQPHYPAKPGGF